MTTTCPNCHQPLRPDARFCARCGAEVTPGAAAASPPPPSGPLPTAAQPAAMERVRQAVSQAGAAAAPVVKDAAAAAAPVVKDAAAAAAPVVKDAAARSWQVSRREMGRAARVLTLGGRAAYTEVTNPQPAAEGFVQTQPSVAWAPPVSEPAAYLFAASFLAIWLLLALPKMLALLTAIGLLVVLLLLAWQGVRRPYFSRLTYRCLWQRLRRRPAQVAQLQCQVQPQHDGQPVAVAVLGYDPAGALAANTYVRVYGILDKNADAVRAWKVETLDNQGRLAGALLAPRLVPLSVGLFLPLLIVLPLLVLRLFL